MANVKEFSVEEKLASLLALQKIESKLDEYKILKGELPMEVSDLEDEIQGLHARQTRVEEEINGIQEFMNQKKQIIKDSDALVKKYEKQSENVKNSREFEAINKEIEMQQLEVKLAEKHIKDANEEVGEKVVLLERAKKNIAAKDGVLKNKKDELDKIIGTTEKEEKHFGKLADEAREKDLRTGDVRGRGPWVHARGRSAGCGCGQCRCARARGPGCRWRGRRCGVRFRRSASRA